MRGLASIWAGYTVLSTNWAFNNLIHSITDATIELTKVKRKAKTV